MITELTSVELEAITTIFDRLEAGQWMSDVFQWATSTFQQLLGILNFNEVFDCWAGVHYIGDYE